MGQSATLYRISKKEFDRISQLDQKEFDYSAVKSSAEFIKSFVGLEFVLAKGQDEISAELIRGIFNPIDALSPDGYENLTWEEKFDAFDAGQVIYYLSPKFISDLNAVLDKITEADIHAKYDSAELNANDVYPAIWHDDESPNLAFNRTNILEDLAGLKTIISQAVAEQDYIFVFVG
jgi:hypothetical protein